ncbi:MAG: phosphate ABC transporter ATP-binding protein [Actinobacteria bacterium]|nr:phosphate ABC transporter ATP-binding protein [Actinomycetota bacterium]
MATSVRFPLQTRGLCLERGGRRVLSDISIHFERAAVTAIVGPSGAGKSSLLRCLNGLEGPMAGEVLLDEVDIRRIEPTELRRRVGMIFQTPVLFPGGVRSNLSYGLRDVSEERLRAALEAAALPEGFLDRESTALSVGQAQRVCIARALVRDPEVLLMDEPTSALDKNAARKIEALLQSLTARGIAILLVTHNLAQARRTSEHAVLLDEGRVRHAGDPASMDAVWPEDVS